MNIYIGNLSSDVSEEQLKELFTEFGEVDSAKIITDKFSGEPRGFAFVEMSSADEGNAAIEALNEREVGGQAITVNEARPKPDRGFQGGRGGGGGRPGGGGRGRPGGGGGGGNRRDSRGGGRGGRGGGGY